MMQLCILCVHDFMHEICWTILGTVLSHVLVYIYIFIFLLIKTRSNENVFRGELYMCTYYTKFICIRDVYVEMCHV